MTKLGRIESAVYRSAKEASLPATDEAGILTARRLARVLDDSDDWEVTKDIAPKLIAALTALGLTNSGRGVVKGKPEGVNDSDKPGATVLQLLRNQYGPDSRSNPA